MTNSDQDHLLAQSVEDFRARQRRGEEPDPTGYARALGPCGASSYEEFLDLLEVEAIFDDLLEPPADGQLPREFGPYTLLREIGRGAVGIVYEARHRELDRREAVKILRPGFLEEAAALERFRQEAQILASLRHPNIVEVFAAGDVDGSPYYAMALVRGTPLSTWVREHRPVDPAKLCRGLAGVADALQMLHDEGIVHRDVKPSNVLVRPDGTMVLADFGLARSLSSARITRSGQALGTPLYMSPEQILGRRGEIDGRTDVYGLGATLYEALAGRPVFRTHDVRALLRQVVTERPEPLRKVAPEVPPPCAQIVMNAIEKRREDRYPTAGALRDDLRAFSEGRQPQRRPVSPFVRAARRVRPFAWPIAAVVLFGVAWLLWYVHRPATLHVETAGFEFVLNGVQRGTGTLDLEVPPGSYDYAFQMVGYQPRQGHLVLRAGEVNNLLLPERIPPIAQDHEEDPQTIGSLASLIGAKTGRFSAATRLREAPKLPTRALLPAGRVRLQDVDEVVYEVGQDFPAKGGTLEFQRGDEEAVAIPVVPPATLNHAPFPRDLLAKLRSGDRVRWRVTAPELDAPWQSFEIVDEPDGLAARLAALDAKLKLQPRPVRLYFEGWSLLEAGLPYAAWRIVPDAAPSAEPGRRNLLEAGILREVLIRLHLAEDNRLWSYYGAAFDVEAPDVRKAWEDAGR